MVGRGLFLGVFFIAYAIQAITGFAGNIIAMPAGMATVGMQESVAMLNATGMIGCGLIAIQNWKHINWRELAIMLVVMTPFMFVGIWLDTVLPLGILSKIYGAIVVVVGVRGLVLKQQRFMPKWLLAVLLVLAGLIQGMFVSGGAILAIYALQRLQDKDQFRATLSCIWMVLNFVYAALQLSQGHYTPDCLVMVAIAIPLLLVATWLGNKLQKRISQATFIKVTYVLLTVIGIRLHRARASLGASGLGLPGGGVGYAELERAWAGWARRGLLSTWLFVSVPRMRRNLLNATSI